jgi:hypothetical protein
MKITPSKRVVIDQKFSKVVNPKAGWYRGDFHTHTRASDGIYPMDILAGVAKAEGLDFVAITDHNTIAALQEPGNNLDILVIPGLEITLNKGHFNVFGLAGWHDWMQDICADQIEVSMPNRYKSITELMQEISAEGLLNSINHPHLPPWEWLFADTDLRHVHCLELWNDLYWPNHVTGNPAAVAMWTEWLNAGHRITAVGGSDYHYPPRPEENKFGERLGMPTTYVYAEELSLTGILDALRKRQAYVTKGLQLDFEAELNGTTYKMGADLGVQSGEIDFIVTIPHQPKKVYVQLVKSGAVIAQEQVKGRDIGIQFRREADATIPQWFRLEVTDKDGDVLAITNPFFLGPGKKIDRYDYNDFKS